MSHLVVTIDIDWACEPAIEQTLDFLQDHQIPVTVFSTHRSPRVESALGEIDIGLHPFFGQNSSHGTTIPEVVSTVMRFPHNLSAFRCHRFGMCNASKQAMIEAGMEISSNVCTDLEVIEPFKERFGVWEVPIFLEDGGYLWRKHPLKMDAQLKQTILGEGTKVLTIHPMHFAINTPDFGYMTSIKQTISRDAWQGMSRNTLSQLSWKGVGIRDLLVEVLTSAPTLSSLKDVIAGARKA